jgi:hypothetical protein
MPNLPSHLIHHNVIHLELRKFALDRREPLQGVRRFSSL